MPNKPVSWASCTVNECSGRDQKNLAWFNHLFTGSLCNHMLQRKNTENILFLWCNASIGMSIWIINFIYDFINIDPGVTECFFRIFCCYFCKAQTICSNLGLLLKVTCNSLPYKLPRTNYTNYIYTSVRNAVHQLRDVIPFDTWSL